MAKENDNKYQVYWNLRVTPSLDDMLNYYVIKLRVKKSKLIRLAVEEKIEKLRQEEIKKQVEKDLGQ